MQQGSCNRLKQCAVISTPSSNIPDRLAEIYSKDDPVPPQVWEAVKEVRKGMGMMWHYAGD